jgi:hypothetical protein
MAKRPLVEQYEALMRRDQAKTTNGESLDASTPLLEALQRDGFVKVPSLVAPHMLLALRGASAYVTQRARDGKWSHIRTVPKQFPPWPSTPPPDTEGGIWGVQHLLHPEMPVRDLFAEIYFSDAVLDVVKQLLGGVSDDELVMELFNLLVSPSGGKDFELCWHRDDVKPDVEPEEEARQLEEKSPAGRQFHAQYNIALTDDTSLVVVPGSHRRPRTKTERVAEPYESKLPGQVLVELQAGDTVFYDSNILHRGIYKGIDPKSELGRLTLHGSVGLAGHSQERSRQVLQHGVGEWIGRAQFGPEGSNLERAEAMRKRLVAMGSGNDLGYSLDG